MSKYVKLVLTSAVALVALFAVVGSAVASEATVSPAGAIASASEGKLSFTGGSFTIRCNVTLNGSLLRGPIRTEGTGQLGSITEVQIRECEGGSVSGVLFREEEGRAWAIRLVRTLGTAPNSVTGLLFNIVGAKFQLSVFGEAVNCLYAGDNGALMALTATRTAGVYTTGRITALATALPLVSGGFLCPSSGTMAGRFNITAQTITIT